jgi:thioesterase domain-containing protein
MEVHGTLSALNRNGAGAPFFCVPAAAATPLSLYQLSRHLAPQRPCYAFCHAGLDDDRPVESTIEAMSQRLVNAMLAVQPTGPYLLGGYCLGGLVAWDAAAALRRRGAAVAQLALIETVPPLLPPVDRADTREDRHGKNAGVFAASLAQLWVAIDSRTEHHLDKFPAAEALRLRRVNSTHTRAGGLYTSGGQEIPVVLFRTRSSSAAVFDAWPQFARGEFSVVTVAGDRDSLLLPPDVAQLGEALGVALDAATR